MKKEREQNVRELKEAERWLKNEIKLNPGKEVSYSTGCGNIVKNRTDAIEEIDKKLEDLRDKMAAL